MNSLIIRRVLDEADYMIKTNNTIRNKATINKTMMTNLPNVILDWLLFIVRALYIKLHLQKYSYLCLRTIVLESMFLL